MFTVNDYRPIATQYEEVFRNILQDMKDNREQRPMGRLIPENLPIEESIDKLFETFSTDNRYGIFTILDFQMPTSKKAIIIWKNAAPLSGAGATYNYSVREDNSVQFAYLGITFRS